jgi:hypothetical protein
VRSTASWPQLNLMTTFPSPWAVGGRRWRGPERSEGAQGKLRESGEGIPSAIFKAGHGFSLPFREAQGLKKLSPKELETRC